MQGPAPEEAVDRHLLTWRTFARQKMEDTIQKCTYLSVIQSTTTWLVIHSTVLECVNDNKKKQNKNI